MWQKKIKKAIFTLCIDGFDEEVTDISFPLLKEYARKINAEFIPITERKFPEWPITYEKLQIYKIGQEMENDWNIYLDVDALIHPDMIDFTAIIQKDTVMHFGSDFASQRWKYDRYFLRDGRNIGSGNWFTIASDWCIDLWHPLDPSDLTLEEALANIRPLVVEASCKVFNPEHLIDDYILSRNIAKYGFKFTTVRELLEDLKRPNLQGCAWHQYLIEREAKVIEMKKVLRQWGLTK